MEPGRGFFFSAIFACSAFAVGPMSVGILRAQQSVPDAAAIGRGGELLGAQCGFCHGSNARGGSTGPDLTRSTMVQEDENGKQLGEFLKVGRPERNMPKFELTPQEVTDLATFLHSSIYQIGNRGDYKILDILT